MKHENTDVFLENKSLKSKFSFLELNLSEVFYPTPNNLEQENKVLHELLNWVEKYTYCHNRTQMETEGYRFPPIDPSISPENDWYRFECWLKEKPIRLTLKEQLPANLILPPSQTLSDEALSVILINLTERLHQIHFAVELSEGIPDRLLYDYMLECLDEEFDIINEGVWHLDGCSGYCPSCFQRPWCEAGNSSCWKEDEVVGEMFLIDSVQAFVSSTPMSLKILRQLQAEEDEKLDEIRKKYSDSDDDDDDILF